MAQEKWHIRTEQTFDPPLNLGSNKTLSGNLRNNTGHTYAVEKI